MCNLNTQRFHGRVIFFAIMKHLILYRIHIRYAGYFEIYFNDRNRTTEV